MGIWGKALAVDSWVLRTKPSAIGGNEVWGPSPQRQSITPYEGKIYSWGKFYLRKG